MGKLVERIRRKIIGRDPRLLPKAMRLDEREDLAEYEIGRFSWGHLTVSYRTPGTSLSIGQFSSLAYGCRVVLGGEHRTDFVSTYRFAYPPFIEDHPELRHSTVGDAGPVEIGNDVWIGHEVLILSGVTIGDGAIVGAGSVVRSNIPPYAIAVGNPARVAGFRFPPEQIAALLAIRWWDWPLERIREEVPQLTSDNVQEFIDAHNPDGD